MEHIEKMQELYCRARQRFPAMAYAEAADLALVWYTAQFNELSADERVDLIKARSHLLADKHSIEAEHGRALLDIIDRLTKGL